MDLLEDIGKIQVHSEEEVVFEATRIIADMFVEAHREATIDWVCSLND